jgi:RNA polymerase sigma-B factor
MPLITHEACLPIARVTDEELFRRWQQDQDARARDALVQRFLPMARKLARRYRQSSVPTEDLIQVASLGLLKAIDRFDPDRGRFASYAIPTILGEIRRHFRDCGWATHVPRGAQERALAIRDAIDGLAATAGHEPTANELAVYLEMDVEQVVDGLQALRAYEAQSLDAPVEEDQVARVDTIGKEDPNLELVEDRVTVGTATRSLAARDREILRLRFVEELTQDEIGARMGVSQMQVSRILNRLISGLAERLTGPGTAISRRRP